MTKRISKEDRDSIIRMHMGGYDNGVISKSLGYTYTQVQYTVKLHKESNGTIKRQLTPEQRGQVFHLRKQGWRINDIANKMNVTARTIFNILSPLNKQDNNIHLSSEKGGEAQ